MKLQKLNECIAYADCYKILFLFDNLNTLKTKLLKAKSLFVQILMSSTIFINIYIFHPEVIYSFYPEVIYSFHSEVKWLIWKLEWIKDNIGRSKVSALSN